MELSDNAAMIPVGFGWSDVGNWSSLEEVAPRDKGRQRGERASDRYGQQQLRVVGADRRVVATIGLSDMVVVDYTRRNVNLSEVPLSGRETNG